MILGNPYLLGGKTYDGMVLNVDVAPTILDLAGVDVPMSYQGKSLTAFDDNQPNNWHTSVFFEHQRAGDPLLPKTECFRNETWKFIRYEANPEYIELYNLKKDANEVNNLAFDPKYADRIAYYASKCDSVVEGLMAQRIKQ